MSKIVVFKITGLSPLLTHNPASMKQSNSGKLGQKNIPTREEEAAAGCYKNEDGTFYIPSESFRQSIVGAGGGASGRRIGKKSASSIVCAGVFTTEVSCTLLSIDTDKPIKKYEIHTCRAVVQRQGVLRSRPMFKDWGCKLPLEIDEDFITPEIVLELLNISGKIAGVGDFRPQRKGTFGRYKAEIESIS